jgi:membrane-bound metal-dependent hydrolase YbcI (DUF457 family)
MAVGALASLMIREGVLELMVIGGFFGILPDFDLLFSHIWNRAHRSVGSHSLIAAGMMALAWYLVVRFIVEPQGFVELGSLLMPSAVVAFAASFLHAAEDSMTKQGCRLLYPVSRRRFRGPVRYDDLATNSILYLAATVVIIVCMARQGVLQ